MPPGARVALLLSALVGCARLPTTPPKFPTTTWHDHSARMEQLSEWQVSGRFSIAQGGKGWSGGLIWLRRHDGEVLTITDPLGRAVARLSSNGNGASLEFANGTSQQGPDLQSLAQKTPAAGIPVTLLDAWLRGLPASGKEHRLQLNDSQQAARIEQSGWIITYQRYRNFDGWTLPQKLSALNSTTQLRLAVTAWSIGPPGG